MQEYSTHSAGKESVGSLALILFQVLSTYGFLHTLDIGGEVPRLVEPRQILANPSLFDKQLG
jgi:hypothetical protein